MLQKHVECSCVVLGMLLPFSEVILPVILTEAECATAKVCPVEKFVLIVIHKKPSCEYP